MSGFRKVTGDFWASPQIALADIEEARRLGFASVINNRPEGEDPDQPEGDAIARAAQAAGLTYRAIPVSHAGFSEAQVDAMVEALTQATGPVLAFCRSGTRSTLLWSLAQARLGRDLQEITDHAAGAGYDVTSIRPLMEMLAESRPS